MKTKQMLIMSLVLCLVFMWALVKLVNSKDLTFTYDGEIDQAFCGYGFQISIDPVLPTIDDTIRVTSSGEWSTLCVPEYQSYQVVSNVIRIDLVYDPSAICPAIITPWRQTVDVGTLPSGIYEVNVCINDVCCGTKSFIVAGQINLKPYRVLVVSGVQMRDDYVIHDAWDFGDIVALLKLWGVPFDIPRLDMHTMALGDFVDGTGRPKYGAIIWTARQDQYPWQPQDYSILVQAVNDHHIGLVAVGNKILEPLIQDLLGLTCGDDDDVVDCWCSISDPVIIDAPLHFITRNLAGTIVPASEAFPGGSGPKVTITATDVDELATAGTWPQLTARTIDADSRTRAVWIGGHPDYVFHRSPTFIELLQRSLVWALGYGVYKDYGHSVVLRMDDPGGAPSAYWGNWHYPQVGQQVINDYIIAPLQAHTATLGVGFNPGYPWIPTRSITRSCGVDFIDPFCTRQNIVSTCAGLRDGIEAGVLEVHSHGLTHMVPDLDTPIPGSTNWWAGGTCGEWCEWGWYREFCDTRRNKEVDTEIQKSRLITSANWIEEDFEVRPLTFIPPGHAISGAHFTATVTITGAMSYTSYSAYYGGPPWTDLGCSFATDGNGDGQCVFVFPPCMLGTTGTYFTINHQGTGTQFIGGPVEDPPGYYFFYFHLRDRDHMTDEERAKFYLADEIFDDGSVVGIGLHIADNYTYKLAGEAGYGLALDDTAHYLGEDYVVTLRVCAANDLQVSFDRGVPAVWYFHDRDICYCANYLANLLSSIDSTWPDVYYMSMDEWSGYVHVQLDATAPTTDSVQFDFAYDSHYCRYFDDHTSTWTLHLSDEVITDFRALGKIQIMMDGTVIDTVDAATYFTETQELTVPPGVGPHTILFRPVLVYLPLIIRQN